MKTLNRRQFLVASSAAVAAGCATTRSETPEIIDTHTHFYDPARPEGVPWPDKNDALLYRTVLPPEYIAMARPLGIAGTVVVEASPRVEDNDWILKLAAREPFLLGFVGHLKPGTAGFPDDLKRLSANRRFRGMRTGGWNIPVSPEKTDFVRDLRLLAERGLSLDVLGGPDQLPAITTLAQNIPGLRIIIDHCGGVRIDGKTPDPRWMENIRQAAREPNIYLKVSGLPENTGRAGEAPVQTEYYRPVLDVLWETFGEDRLIFGSNWPVSARFATLEGILEIVRPYFEEKGRRASEKYFRRNAERFYGLV